MTTRADSKKRLPFILTIIGACCAAAFVAVFRFLLRAGSHHNATDRNPSAANVKPRTAQFV